MATSRFPKQIQAVEGYLLPLTFFNLLFGVQLLAAIVYAVALDLPVSSPRRMLLPFVWTSAAVLAAVFVGMPRRDRRTRFIAAAIAGGYFLFVLYLSGAIGPATGWVTAAMGRSGLQIEWWRSLGWAPVIIYAGETISAILIPYQFIGYLGLAYLLYGAVLDVSKSFTAGLLGIIACPSCAAPVLIPAIAGLAGTSSAFALLGAFSYEIATVFFLGAVGLLYWRPVLTPTRWERLPTLRITAAGLAIFVAALHLAHPTYGFPRLLQYVAVGTVYDPRPVLFTASGLAILVGVAIGIRTTRPPLYLAGIAMMGTYLVGFAAWHTVLDHGAFWPYIRAHPHTDAGPLMLIIQHLLVDRYALVSKLAELSLLGILGGLYWQEGD